MNESITDLLILKGPKKEKVHREVNRSDYKITREFDRRERRCIVSLLM